MLGVVTLVMSFLQFVVVLPEKHKRKCTSSIFGSPHDRWAGGKALYLGRKVNKHDVGVAHRSLPLGSGVIVCNPRKANRCVYATVIDRGPYGALATEDELTKAGHACRLRPMGKCWYVKKKRSWPGRWRGCLDLTPKAARLIGHNGFQKVNYWSVP